MIQDFINKQFFSLFVFTLIFGLLLYGTIGFDFIVSKDNLFVYI